jgi:hypothetical protein
MCELTHVREREEKRPHVWSHTVHTAGRTTRADCTTAEQPHVQTVQQQDNRTCELYNAFIAGRMARANRTMHLLLVVRHVRTIQPQINHIATRAGHKHTNCGPYNRLNV